MLPRLEHLGNQLHPVMAADSTPGKSDITLYTGQTPNGIKISITLEELG